MNSAMRNLKSDKPLPNLYRHRSLSKLNEQTDMDYKRRERSFNSTYNMERLLKQHMTQRYQYQSSSSTELNKEIKRPVSLSNISSNCYLNAGLQALSSCGIFVSELQQLQLQHNELEKLKVFSHLIQALFYVHQPYLELTHHPVFENWNKTGQQDSFELLTFIINEVFDEIKKKIKKNKSGDTCMEAKLPMRIILEHEINCCTKNTISRHRQCDIALHIPFCKSNGQSRVDSYELEYLLDQNFKPEVIEDYKCSVKNCNGFHARKSMRLCQPLPSTICIHLQRLFSKNGKMTKINNKVIFSKEITLKHSYCVEGVLDETYILKSVIVHYGDAFFGHYICYKLFNDCWFYTDDSSIRETDLETVLNCQAYILFYEKEREIMNISNQTSSSIKDFNTSSLSSIHSNAFERNSDVSRIENPFKKEYQSDAPKDYNPDLSILSCFHAIISALRICPNFIDKFKEHLNDTNFSLKQKKIIRCIIKSDDLLTIDILDINDCSGIDIFKAFSKIINMVYKDDLDQDESQNNILSRKCPLRISLKIHEECPSHSILIYTLSQYTFGLNDSTEDSLQNLFEKEFDRKYIFDEKSVKKKCNCLKSQFIRFHEPLPETICFHIEEDFIFFRKDFNKICIKRNMFSNDNLPSSTSIFKSLNTNEMKSMDHKYLLRSIVKYEYSGFKCYKFADEKFIKIDSLKTTESFEHLILHKNDILFFEKELTNNLQWSTISPILSGSVLFQNDIDVTKKPNISSKLEIFPIRLKSQLGCGKLKEGENHSHLELILCALSNCSKLIGELQKVIEQDLRAQCVLLRELYLVLKTFEQSNLSSIADKIENLLEVEYSTNLFQFIFTFFKYLDQEWRSVQIVNPLKLNKVVKFKGCSCNLSNKGEENGFSINIPVQSRRRNSLHYYETINIQDSVDQIFKEQSLESYQCQGQCLKRNDRLVIQLCSPYPKIVVVHIENVVWNGENNENFDTNVLFNDSLHIDSKYLQLNNEKSLHYKLKSIITYEKNQYNCYMKDDEKWYQGKNFKILSNSYIYSVRSPNIMFYEIIDT